MQLLWTTVGQLLQITVVRLSAETSTVMRNYYQSKNKVFSTVIANYFLKTYHICLYNNVYPY